MTATNSDRAGKKEPETPQGRYNKKRVRLCEFSVTKEQAKTVRPALDRLEAHHGSKVQALCNAVLDADRALTESKEK